MAIVWLAALHRTNPFRHQKILSAHCFAGMIANMHWTQQMRTILAAAVDRIIPEDDFPGAWAAGAGEYIERILAGDLHHRADEFARGLQAIEAEAMHRFGAPFASLDAQKQDAILAAIEREEVATVPADFFRWLVELTSEGYYSDPGSGGNRRMISWEMVGFDPKT